MTVRYGFKNYEKDEKLVIAFTPTCAALGTTPSEDMVKLVKEGIGDKIYEYASEHPFIIKDYKEGFPVIMENNDTRSKGLKSHEIAHKWENALLTQHHVIRIKQND